MRAVLMERDSRSGATYYQLAKDAEVARTVHVSDLIMVDLDKWNSPVGVEFAMNFRQITEDHRNRLLNVFPDLKEVFPDVESLLVGPRG